jgi:ribosomal RNA-processing protein 1
MKLTAQLAHNNKVERDRAVRKLKKYLTSEKALHLLKNEPIESAKLWKALYYCFFNSDKAHIQQELSDEMANLIFCFKGNSIVAVNWMRAFWETVDREWAVMDKHRIDKYYALMRKIIRATFSFAIHSDCSVELMEILSETCLRPKSLHKGVTLHVVDVFIPEMISAIGSEKVEFSMVKNLFIPLNNLLTDADTDIIVADRVIESGFAALFQEIAVDEEELAQVRQQLDRGEEEDLPERSGLIITLKENCQGMVEMFTALSSKAGKQINRQRRNDLNDLIKIYSQVDVQ